MVHGIGVWTRATNTENIIQFSGLVIRYAMYLGSSIAFVQIADYNYYVQ
jgi:hypothetical protein